jgi:hypothetical protein
MDMMALKRPDPYIDEIENEMRRTEFFMNKWQNWRNFRLLVTFGPVGAALVFLFIWAVSY